MHLNTIEYKNNSCFHETSDNWTAEISIEDITINQLKDLITLVQYFICDYENINFNFKT